MTYYPDENDRIARPIIAIGHDYPDSFELAEHRHRRSQFLYAATGVMAVSTPSGVSKRLTISSTTRMGSALAAFAAAPIARESGLKIGLQAVRIAVAGFVVPYMAVYSPALMLQTGTWLDTAWVLFKALVAVSMWGAGAIGYLWGPLNWAERSVAIVAASLLVVAAPLTDEIGLAAVAAFLLWYRWRSKK